MEGMDLFSEYNYDYLKSQKKTNYDKDVPVKEVLLNLTGNMNRYIWHERCAIMKQIKLK
jgi:hypothetical protein